MTLYWIAYNHEDKIDSYGYNPDETSSEISSPNIKEIKEFSDHTEWSKSLSEHNFEAASEEKVEASFVKEEPVAEEIVFAAEIVPSEEMVTAEEIIEKVNEEVASEESIGETEENKENL